MSNLDQIQLTRSPIDDSVYVERELASPSHLETVVMLAKQAETSWQQIPLSQRQAMCHKMVDAFVQKKQEIAEQLCWMMGRPIRFAHLEVDGMAERARYMIDAAPDALKSIHLPAKANFTRFIQRVPLGTVFVMAPWNYPYLTAVNTVIPAIVAGNTVILKHSAQTPLCAEQFAYAFEQAGFSRGVFQYLHLSHEAAQSLIADSRINQVTFTGSVNGGRQVEAACAGQFKPTALELGGKDPAYVRADADLTHAVATCVDGAFFNSGQSCCGIERIYVAESLFDDFVEQATALIAEYQLGRPDDPNTTLGPMVSASAADFVRGQIEDAVKTGAICHLNPKDFAMDCAGTPYMAPQLLTKVDHSMRLMTEESFGPVVGVMKVHDDEEAIHLMNDSDFGLTAAVFTKDIDAAIEIGEQLQTGTFFVNRCDYLDPALAWVGVKHSGKGCSLSQLGYQQLTRPKSFHIKTGEL